MQASGFKAILSFCVTILCACCFSCRYSYQPSDLVSHSGGSPVSFNCFDMLLNTNQSKILYFGVYASV